MQSYKAQKGESESTNETKTQDIQNKFWSYYGMAIGLGGQYVWHFSIFQQYGGKKSLSDLN